MPEVVDCRFSLHQKRETFPWLDVLCRDVSKLDEVSEDEFESGAVLIFWEVIRLDRLKIQTDSFLIGTKNSERSNTKGVNSIVVEDANQNLVVETRQA